MTKADELSESASFAAAASPPSDRRRLIATVTGEADAPPPRTALLAELAFNPFNPRRTLTELPEMASTLLEQGQLEALTVVTRDAFLAAHLPEHPDCEAELGAARFVVIDGNRRLGGAQLAGLEEMRIDVNDDLASSAADVLEKALVIGIQHQSLSPLDEARALAHLLKVHGSQRAVGRRITRTHVWVSQRLALLDLISDLQAALEAGELPVEDARKIARLPQDEQAAAVSTTGTARRSRNNQRRTRDVRAAPSADDAQGPGAAGETGVSATPPPPGQQSDDAGLPPDQPQPRADGGNGVSATPPPPQADLSGLWDDLPSLAAFLRKHLGSQDLQALADLLTTAG